MTTNPLADLAAKVGARLEDSEREDEAMANAPSSPYDKQGAPAPELIVFHSDGAFCISKAAKYTKCRRADGRDVSQEHIQAYDEIKHKLFRKMAKLGHKIQSDRNIPDSSVMDAWSEMITADPLASIMKQKLGKDLGILLNTTLAYYGGFNNCDEKKLSTAYFSEAGTLPRTGEGYLTWPLDQRLSALSSARRGRRW